MPAETSNSTAETPPAAQTSRARVLTMIALTGAIFVGLFVILYVRWAAADLPSSVLLVAISPAFEGSVIEVSSPALPKPHSVTVHGQKGVIPFYLDQGTYTLRILHGGRSIYTTDFFVESNAGRKVDLNLMEDLLPPSPATAPSARAGDAPD